MNMQELLQKRAKAIKAQEEIMSKACLLYTSPSPRDCS